MEKLKGMATMDLILTLMGAALVAYIIVDLVVFCIKGDEPSTLTTCVFGACSAEGFFMCLIKRGKQRNDDKNGSNRGASEEPKEGEEL
jgi:hypothetical protein